MLSFHFQFLDLIIVFATTLQDIEYIHEKEIHVWLLNA